MKTPKLLIPFLAATALLSTSTLSAATTDPVGYVTVTVPGGAAGSPSVSVLSLPLLNSVEGVTGISSGATTSITSNQLTVTGAGWTAGALSTEAEPFFIQMTSGSANGRFLLITSNTSDSITLNTEGVDLDASATAGDTFQLVPGDTLLSVFGTPTDGIVGGTTSEGSQNAGLVDEVFLLSGSGWSRYFYNTENSRWEIPELSFFGDQGNTVIPPTGGLLFKRVGAEFDMVLTGRVPMESVKPVLRTNGTTLVSISSPSGDTLGGLEVQNTAGWRAVGDSGVDASNADLVFMLNNGWKKYYYNRTTGEWLIPELEFFGDQSTEVIPAGAALIFSRLGVAGTEIFDHAMPYTL